MKQEEKLQEAISHIFRRLSPISRGVFIGRALVNITQEYYKAKWFDRVMLAACVWKRQDVLSLYTSDATLLFRHGATHRVVSKAPDIFHGFERSPLLCPFSDIITLPINFASGSEFATEQTCRHFVPISKRAISCGFGFSFKSVRLSLPAAVQRFNFA